MIRTEYPIVRVWGIPIKVHLALLLLLPLLAVQYAPLLEAHGAGGAGWLWGLGLAVAIFACVALHELGHALAALRLGCKVREIVLLPIGGVAQLVQMPRRPRSEIILALAGPAVNLVLAMAFFLAARAAYQRLAAVPALGHVLGFLIEANLFLALFNLLPAFPLDGGRVLRALLTPRFGRLRATRWAMNTGKTLAALMFALVFGGALLMENWGLAVLQNSWLLVIAIFLFTTADIEYRLAQIEERRRQTAARHQAAAANGELVTVSPSPYQKGAGPVQIEPVREFRKRGRTWIG